MLSLIKAAKVGQCHIDVVGVVCNRPRAAGLQLAQDAGVETTVVDHTRFDSREDFDAELAKAIEQYDAELVILAGFMRILTAGFTQQFEGRMLNIHPSLLPKYPGINTHQRALDAGDKEHGASIHFVTAELDGGPVILQSVIPIKKNDNADKLMARVLLTEHPLYVTAADWFGRGLLTFVANDVFLCEQKLDKPVLLKDGQLEGVPDECLRLLQN